ncbi:MAG: response regulator [Pseudomonadota bacterium]
MSDILIMEDNVMLSRLLADSLEADGHTATITHDAEDAMSALTAKPYDLLVADVFVGNDDRGRADGGILLIGRVRDAARRSVRNFSADMPIIAISAGFGDHVRISMEKLTKSVGANAFLKKPFAAGDFKGAVDRALPPKAA